MEDKKETWKLMAFGMSKETADEFAEVARGKGDIVKIVKDTVGYSMLIKIENKQGGKRQ